MLPASLYVSDELLFNVFFFSMYINKGPYLREIYRVISAHTARSVDARSVSAW